MAEKSSGPKITAGASPPARAAHWWLYLLACADGRTYAGIAIDVQARFRLHLAGKGAKFTRANPPVKILGAQAFPDQGAALRAEFALKQLSKLDKLRWAQRWSVQAASTTKTKHSVRRAPNRPPRQSRPKT